MGKLVSNTLGKAGDLLGGVASDILPIASIGAGIATGSPGLVLGGLGMLSGGQQGQQAQQANQQVAQGLQFRPVGITNTFGTSNFTYNPSTGQMEKAGYTLSPDLQAIQDYVMGQTRASLGDVSTAQNIGRSYMGDSQGAPVQALGQQFMGSTVGKPITALGQQFMGSDVGQPLTSLGQGYLALSPEQAAADWMNKQQAVLAASRENQLANVRSNLAQTGRTGLSVAQGGALGASNPELQAYYNALAQQDAQLAAQAAAQGRAQQQFGADLYQTGTGLTKAQQLAGAGLYGTGTELTQAQQLAGAGLYGTGIGLTQQGIGFGQGLLSSAYNPLGTALNTAGSVEALGQQPLQLSSGLAGNAALGASRAAPYQYAASSYNPLASMLGGALTNQNLMSGLGGLFSNAPSWTTGSSVIPQSTFSGLGGDYSLIGGADMASLFGL